MKIGISYWGFCEKFEDSRVSQTPDGHRYGRPLFVDELLKRGHEVFALQTQREVRPYPGIQYDSTGFPELDVVFFEWRWPTYKNSGPAKFERDLDRQTELLEHYHGQTPVVVWDCDLKLTPADEACWPKMIVADPTLQPKDFIIKRVRLPFWSDFELLMPLSNTNLEFGYVGNNYERAEMFKKYYSDAAQPLRELGVQTRVVGNWLERSPEREQPEEIITNYPHVAFFNRVGFYESMHILNKLISTVHITKGRYASQGFVSPRYLESLVVGMPALVPVEFANSSILGKEWVVSNSADVVKKVEMLKGLDVQARNQVVNAQATALQCTCDFSVEAAVCFFEEIAANPGTATKNI